MNTQTASQPFFRWPGSNDPFLALRREIKANLELSHVNEQRGFISKAFEFDAWEPVGRSPKISSNPDMTRYAAAVQAFSRAFTDMKCYEAFYLSSIDTRSRENAVVLHDKKEALEEMARELRPLILRADGQMRLIKGGLDAR